MADSMAAARMLGDAGTLPRALQRLVYPPVSSLVDGAAAHVRIRRPGQSFADLLDEAIRTRPRPRVLPEPLRDGRLPAGIHDVDLGSFLLRHATDEHRTSLLRPFAQEVLRLQREGVREVYVGGSMLHLGRTPGDVDALARLSDSHRLGIVPRLRAWAAGIHWHTLERRHVSLDPIWGGRRPTWLEFFQTGRDGQPQGVARIMLAPEARQRG